MSDWSSDVCSSDLAGLERPGGDGDEAAADVRARRVALGVERRIGDDHVEALRQSSGDVMPVESELRARCERREVHPRQFQRARLGLEQVQRGDAGAALQQLRRQVAPAGAEVRSEEHTSELQSLMRTTYAVFCLKKKNKDK